MGQLKLEERGVRDRTNLKLLTISQILTWADAHKSKTGDWPDQSSGKVEDTEETWRGVHQALYGGLRGLRGDSSLAKLLSEHRGVRNIKDLPPLTIEQILAWADGHKNASGQWPNQYSGPVGETGEIWTGIHGALNKGYRGFPGEPPYSKYFGNVHAWLGQQAGW